MNKILVVGLNWIGDVVMSFPALMSLQKVDVLTRPHLAQLYSLCPAVGNVIQIDWGNFANIKLSEIRKIQKEKYSDIIIFPSSFRAAILAFLIGSKNRTGFSGELRANLNKGVIYIMSFRPKGEISDLRRSLTFVRDDSPTEINTQICPLI
jgi:heptosyltransferase II